ncbi:MAG TPA: ABC transporter ATP-binding protein [Myxococcales bacterium]|nr:ABC transporter ATP-binding protein [Myxococcales bacterium]
MSDSEIVLEIRELKKRFWLVELERAFELRFSHMVRAVDAVRNVSMTVNRGQVFGFLGPNGAGKTTTIKMCMDLIRPSGGSIKLFGKAPGDLAVKARVGYLPEHPYFYDYLKPQEILDLFGRIFGLPSKERKARIDMLLDRVGLNHARNRPLRKFSKGMLQRLGVAQALINDPDFLVMDEPLSGLDPVGRKEIRDIIIEERDRGKTVLLCSHILNDIEHLCDRVAIIREGEVVKEGALSELLSSENRKTEILVSNMSPSLKKQYGDKGIEVVDFGGACRLVLDTGHTADVINELVAAGCLLNQVQSHRDSLEDLFLREAVGKEVPHA